MVYTEQVNRPREFLAAIRRCRDVGKPVVLMFPGRSEKSRAAAKSHTGALVGDYATMKTQVEDAGAIVVGTMDEMMDLSEILVRFPKPPAKGPASSPRRARSSDWRTTWPKNLAWSFHNSTRRRSKSSRTHCLRTEITAIRSIQLRVSHRPCCQL